MSFLKVYPPLGKLDTNLVLFEFSFMLAVVNIRDNFNPVGKKGEKNRDGGF
jgi:hypothetical protein